MKRPRETENAETEMENGQGEIASFVLSIKVVIGILSSFLTLKEMAPLGQTCHSIRNALMQECIEYRQTCYLQATPIFAEDAFIRGLLTSDRTKCIRLAWQRLNSTVSSDVFFAGYFNCVEVVAKHSSFETIRDTLSYCIDDCVEHKYDLFKAVFNGYMVSKKMNLQGLEKLLSCNVWSRQSTVIPNYDIDDRNNDNGNNDNGDVPTPTKFLTIGEISRILKWTYVMGSPDLAKKIHILFEKYIIDKDDVNSVNVIIICSSMLSDNCLTLHHLTERITPKNVIDSLIEMGAKFRNLLRIDEFEEFNPDNFVAAENYKAKLGRLLEILKRRINNECPRSLEFFVQYVNRLE